MYAATARSALAVSSRCSSVHFHFLTAALLASNAVADELQYLPNHITSASYMAELPDYMQHV